MLVYIIHPLVIIAVGGVAKIINLQELLVYNNLIHFSVVMFSSWIIAKNIDKFMNKKKEIIL